MTIYLLKPPSGIRRLPDDGQPRLLLDAAGSGYDGLPTGGYYVQTNNTLGYVDELYDNIPCVGCDVTVGTKVQLTAGATTAGVNFALAKGGGGPAIAGTVTRAGTGDPLPLLHRPDLRLDGRPGELPDHELAGDLPERRPARRHVLRRGDRERGRLRERALQQRAVLLRLQSHHAGTPVHGDAPAPPPPASTSPSTREAASRAG